MGADLFAKTLAGTRQGWSVRMGLLVSCAALLAGCGTSSAPTPVVATPTVAVTSEELVGKWGLASYREETDKVRTEAAAKAACTNPYVIGKGAQGGVTMHLADQATPQEVYLKTASDGGVYIGPQGKPGERADRQILSYDKGVMVTRWVDPGVAKRYGTMMFVRCAVA
ncbi:hypothetical protein BA190_18465 [Labrys sp. WJW]|nr:hypothetical protein BA190_18465 [Labrys sp. WJW]